MKKKEWNYGREVPRTTKILAHKIMRTYEFKIVTYKNTKGILSGEEYINLFLLEVSGFPLHLCTEHRIFEARGFS